MPHLVSLGMFIIDEFQFLDENGRKMGLHRPPQIGGGGTYATVGARIWLSPDKVGMIVDRGDDFPPELEQSMLHFGSEMWLFRDKQERLTTRAMNVYAGEHRGFEYLTPRIRITPHDIRGTKLAGPNQLHFICSPRRAAEILSEVHQIEGWRPFTIFEPIPDRCVPSELPPLIEILSQIEVLSPNAEEALSLLSLPKVLTKSLVEQACETFLRYGIGEGGNGHVVIRCGEMGAYVGSRRRAGIWVEAYWTKEELDKVIDVTGAGNSFLGGLSAGLHFTDDVFEAVFYASVSASFTVEQYGLPHLTSGIKSDPNEELWNGERPRDRLTTLRNRHTSHQ